MPVARLPAGKCKPINIKNVAMHNNLDIQCCGAYINIITIVKRSYGQIR